MEHCGPPDIFNEEPVAQWLATDRVEGSRPVA